MVFQVKRVCGSLGRYEQCADGEETSGNGVPGVAVDGVPVAGIIGQPFFGWDANVNDSKHLENLGRVV